MAFGVVASALLLGVVFTAVVILVDSGLILLLAHFLDFADKRYRTAFAVSVFIGLANFLSSLLALLFRRQAFLLEIFGILLFVVVSHLLIKWKYRESLRQRLTLLAVLVLLAIALNFVSAMLVTSLFNVLNIG